MRSLVALALFIFAVVPNIQAQFNVSGKIISASDSRPVAAASVFFTNTSFGTVSANDGSFRLTNIPPGNYDLVVSYIGYGTTQKNINISNGDIQDIVVSLKEKPKEMETVIVGGYEKQTWEKWGRFFTEQFIGAGSWGNNCVLENHKELSFLFYKKANRLVAFADAELLITNKNLGYRIRYRLEKFEYDFNTKMLYYEGYPLFEEMDAKRTAKKNRWIKARNEAFSGSMMHFMRSLFRNKLQEEGFEIRRLVKTPNYEKKRIQLLYRERAKQDIRDKKPPSFNFGDSSEYYQKILQQNDWDDRYSPYTVNGDSIAYGEDAYTAALEFENHLYIVYKKALEDQDYALVYSGRGGQKNPASAITLVNNKKVLLFANGAYYKMQDLVSNGYWAWSEKICRMLPFDYKPAPQ